MRRSKDLEEYTDAELRIELIRRAHHRMKKECSYCGKKLDVCICKVNGRLKGDILTDIVNDSFVDDED